MVVPGTANVNAVIAVADTVAEHVVNGPVAVAVVVALVLEFVKETMLVRFAEVGIDRVLASYRNNVWLHRRCHLVRTICAARFTFPVVEVFRLRCLG